MRAAARLDRNGNLAISIGDITGVKVMAEAARILEIVGGNGATGLGDGYPPDLVQLIRRGLPIHALQFMIDSGRLTPAELDTIVLPRKTLAHRRKLGSLTPEQSDRLLRLARVIATAEEVFGDREKSAMWLRRPTTALAGDKPLALLDTSEGARRVETLLGRIAHGIAA